LDYREATVLRVAGVSAVASSAPVDRSSLAAAAQLLRLPGEWLDVEGALTRARLLRAVYATDDPAYDIAHVDTEHVALIDVADRARVERHLHDSSNGASNVGWTNVTIDRPGYIVVESHAQAPAILALTESFHRGWKAAAGETPLAAIRVNGDFLGCLVPAGKVKVEFSFVPASLFYGRLLSVCGLGFLLILLATSRRSHFCCSEGA
jgi:hypothetical protein